MQNHPLREAVCLHRGRGWKSFSGSEFLGLGEGQVSALGSAHFGKQEVNKVAVPSCGERLIRD